MSARSLSRVKGARYPWWVGAPLAGFVKAMGFVEGAFRSLGDTRVSWGVAGGRRPWANAAIL